MFLKFERQPSLDDPLNFLNQYNSNDFKEQNLCLVFYRVFIMRSSAVICWHLCHPCICIWIWLRMNRTASRRLDIIVCWYDRKKNRVAKRLWRLNFRENPEKQTVTIYINRQKWDDYLALGFFCFVFLFRSSSPKYKF